jgi:hypothetical protein
VIKSGSCVALPTIRWRCCHYKVYNFVLFDRDNITVCDLFNKNKNNFPVLCVLFDPRYIYEYGPVLKECWYRYCSSNTHYHKNLTFTMTLKEVGGILKKN